MKIGIGYNEGRPTWEWLGLDMAIELSKRHDIRILGRGDSFEGLEAIILIKYPPTESDVEWCSRNKVPLTYIPVDWYHSQAHLASDGWALSMCDCILIHSERLLQPMMALCKNTILIDHHLRFSLPSLAECRGNEIAYVGDISHTRWILHYLNENPPPLPVRFVIGAINKVRHAELKNTGYHSSVFVWTAVNQLRAMESCRMAIDIKGDTWNQMTKPPTKLQKYIASGIPAMVNRDSYSYEHFVRKHGFIPATSYDECLDGEYLKRVRELAPILRSDLSIEKVADKISGIIEAL